MKTAVCTIIAKNYLPQARVLMQSIRAWNPDAMRVVFLVDSVDGYFEPDKEDFEVILSLDLHIPDSKWFHFKYTILELSTAVKPYALEFLFRRYELEKILYLDPDIQTFAPLQGLFDQLSQANVILTPHLTAPNADDLLPGDLDILRSGAYNLGFIGLASSAETFKFLTWWQNKLYDLCVVDLPRGLFVDQRWVDLVPGMFAGVYINREPGYNVAYWNLQHRKVEKAGQGYLVNGEPLYFFHFSGLDPHNPESFSRHQNRFRLSELGDARSIVLDYRDALTASGSAKCRKWPYAFGFFSNGFPIPDIGRPAHHESSEIRNRVEDPFSEEGLNAFVDLWNQPVMEEAERRSGVSRLSYRIYRTRSDVQAVMPDIFGGDRIRFLEWVLSSGKVEHDLHEMFLAPAWDALQSAGKHKTRSTTDAAENNGNHPPIASGVSSGVASAGSSVVSSEEEAGPLSRLQLTRLARRLYESRPDLQRLFPDPLGRDSVKYLIWLLTYGKKEYRLSDNVLAPLRMQWDKLVDDLPNMRQRLWYRFLLAGMSRSVDVRSAAATVGAKYRFANVARDRRVSRNQTGTAKSRPRIKAPEAEEFGLNVIGYLRAETGVGESVRSAVRSARSVGLPVTIRNIIPTSKCRNSDGSLGSESDQTPYFFNAFHINADVTPTVLPAWDGRMEGRYNIGYWAWELEDFPDRWVPSFGYCQEIWTPSTFCQDAILRKSPIPVLRMPHSVTVTLDKSYSRADFGITTDDFLFLTIFDMLSVFERKNPLAVIDAFLKAFQGAPGCHLIVKINNASSHLRLVALLRNRAAGYPVTFIDKTLARNDLNGLMQVSDSIVSLHRSEGFGLTLAEGMFLGKPVIATGYSGNTDFTKPDNSMLVSYQLKKVGNHCEPYDSEAVWADPDVDEAAQHMRMLAENAELRRRVGSTGQEFVKENLSPSAVGAQIKNRLDTLWRHANSPQQQTARTASHG